MKTFLRVLLVIFLIAILAGGGFLAYLHLSPNKGRDPFSVIPKDVVFIIETNNLSKGWNEVSESNIWNHLMQTDYFADVNEDIESLNTYLKGNPALDKLLEGRELLISAHMLGGVDYDFLFVVDLKKMANISQMKNIKTALTQIEGFAVSERKFEGVDIIELEDQETKDVIHLALIDNILIASYSGQIMESSISQKDDEHWEKDKKFQQIAEEISEGRLFSFYFNYNMLDKFSQVYLTEENDIIQMLNSSLRYSAMNAYLEEDQLIFDGATNVDSLPSYIRVLSEVSPGKTRAHEIISDQAAVYFSMSFDEYNDFFTKLKEEFSISNEQDYKDYEKNIARVEKLLKLNLEEVFFSWIGHEIAFVKMRPTGKTRIEDVVVAIHAKDINQAKAGLDKMTTQVRRRSPLKFEIRNYRNFEINYLEIKGFFKLFLGKLFGQLEKPYYTVIEDYVVFSNSEQTLRDLIDDYSVGRVLSRKAQFMNFRDEFEIKSNLSLFVQMPKIYQNLYYYSTREKREGVKKNKEIILSFARIGFQMASQGDGLMSTTLIAEYDSAAMYDDELEKIEDETAKQMFYKAIDTLDFKVDIPENQIGPDGQYKVYYPDSVLKAEGAIKDGKLFGLWRSYYKSGNIKVSANYEQGKVDGITTFYYDTKELKKKAEAVYEDNELNGVYREFFENGTRKATLNFEEGKLDGDAEFYYPNGEVKIEGKYKNGKKHGRWKFYNRKGEVLTKERWRRGDNKSA